MCIFWNNLPSHSLYYILSNIQKCAKKHLFNSIINRACVIIYYNKIIQSILNARWQQTYHVKSTVYVVLNMRTLPRTMDFTW